MLEGGVPVVLEELDVDVVSSKSNRWMGLQANLGNRVADCGNRQWGMRVSGNMFQSFRDSSGDEWFDATAAAASASSSA